ncbi:WhiB family transcriptional regulator [Streptomyces sp. NPDC058739]|uniref:WhiB family transcriptional regulator n=1 Tax=Streptomyces sp. NPDC058739 TaxID=3346618 RepID=UPI0036A3166D
MTVPLSTSPAGLDWRSRAACVGEDPELFFPLSDSAASEAQAAQARAVCRRCPVLVSCRTWAIDHGEDDGIWGATTASQRRAIRRAVARPDSAPQHGAGQDRHDREEEPWRAGP